MLKLSILVFSLLCLVVGQVSAEAKLVFAIDIIRHGARTPIADIQNPPHLWGAGPGQLLPLGMQQEYHLGVEMRQRYVQHYHLLPPAYQPGVIYVRSTDFDRTLMSAESLLLGLYPLGTGPKLGFEQKLALPGAFQPIPIHTVPVAEDQLFFPLRSRERARLLQQYVYANPDWQKQDAKLKSHYSAWSTATGVNIKQLSTLTSVGSALEIRSSQHVPLPKTLSAEAISTIIASGHWALAASFKPEPIGFALAHNLLEAINQQFVAVSKSESTLKYVLYSAHDTTLLSMLSALKVPLSTQVPYASDLNFMLFEQSEQQYEVQVSFNGHVLKLPGCKQTRCTLAEFDAIAAGQ